MSDSRCNKTLTVSVTGWRIKLGIALFSISIFLPLIGIPIVTTMDLSSTVLATISGVMLVTAEMLGLAAVAVMGKSGFEYIKNRVFILFNRYAPPVVVGRTRYTIGLVMFTLPIVFGWLTPYVADLIPGYSGKELIYAIAGDLLLLASLFVLGGAFWDKLRALFTHDVAEL